MGKWGKFEALWFADLASEDAKIYGALYTVGLLLSSSLFAALPSL